MVVSGTWAALGGVLTMGALSASSWQLLPYSSFLVELPKGPPPPEVESFSTAADRQWVRPLSSTYLPGAPLVTGRSLPCAA